MSNIKTCQLCGSSHKAFLNKRHSMIICNMCRCEIYTNCNELPIIHDKPQYGEVKYSPDGKPICHICGKAYNKLLSHVWQRHNLTEKEYKKEFGLDLYKGIIAKSTRVKLQKSVSNNYELVVRRNLTQAGQKTRFEVGMRGRTLDKISTQTMNRLKRLQIAKGVT